MKLLHIGKAGNIERFSDPDSFSSYALSVSASCALAAPRYFIFSASLWNSSMSSLIL